MTNFTPRRATVERETSETRVSIKLALDGEGKYSNSTGIGFLDHILDHFARHGGFDLKIECEGDLRIDAHHTTEDVGIALGEAFAEALGEKQYVARYGSAYVPMDEALARAVVDLSGRFYLVYHACLARAQVGELPTELVRHFWYSFAEHAECNLHISVLYGDNSHHQIEAMFKATARALREAVSREERHGEVLSTKGVL